MQNDKSSFDKFLMRCALMVLATTMLFMFFGRGFIDPDEGRYAEIPREMVASGNWLEMRMLDYRYYEKPPLAYWLTAPAIAVFGARDWAARIPLFINMALIVLLFYRIACRYWPLRTARRAIMISVASVGSAAGLSLLMTDPFLTFFFALTCHWAFQWFQTPVEESSRRAYLAILVGLAAALGFLTKGLVALVLPAGIVFLWMIWEKRWRSLRFSLFILAGGALAIVGGGVLLLLEEHNPGFFYHFIYEEHIARFTGTRAIQGHPESPWFFVKVIPLLLAPWTLFAVRAVYLMIKRQALRNDQLSRILLVWSVVVVVFFSISTGKLMSYIMPAIPPLTLLLARWGIIEPRYDSPADRRLIRLGIAGTVLLLIGLPVAWLASYFQILPGLVERVDGISILAFIPLALALPALRRLRRPDFLPALLWINSVIFMSLALLLSPLPGRAFNTTVHQNSSLAYQELADHLQPEDQIVVLWAYRPALPFYTDRLYRPFQDRNELKYGMQLEPERPTEMKHPDEIRQILADAPARVYAVIEPFYYPDRLREIGLKYRETGLQGDTKTLILELLP